MNLKDIKEILTEVDLRIKNRSLNDHFKQKESIKLRYYKNLTSSREAIYEEVDGKISIINLEKEINESIDCSDRTIKEKVSSILEYAINQELNVLPLPKSEFKEDQENATEFFAKTGYYEPETKQIVIYTSGRHAKDVVRSFCHELIHHMQNLQGKLTEMENTEDTTKGGKLLEIEAEAYLHGNLLFRNWEDTIKYA